MGQETFNSQILVALLMTAVGILARNEVLVDDTVGGIRAASGAFALLEFGLEGVRAVRIIMRGSSAAVGNILRFEPFYTRTEMCADKA